MVADGASLNEIMRSAHVDHRTIKTYFLTPGGKSAAVRITPRPQGQRTSRRIGVEVTKRYFYGDIESFSVGRQYDMSPREFFRLGQFAINDGPVTLTEDYDYFMEELRASDYIIFHNGISFDMSVLFGYDSVEPLYMAMDRRVIDTYYLANLLNPVPQSYRMRSGRYAVESSDPVGHAKSWLSLDNQCYNLGLPGKIGDLKEIVKRYNPRVLKLLI